MVQLKTNGFNGLAALASILEQERHVTLKCVQVLGCTIIGVGVLVEPSVPVAAQEQADTPRATFRSGVELVALTATVKDQRGRLVRDLERQDFQVIESGKERPIVDFKPTDQGPIHVAFLFDQSGSMGLGATGMGTNLQAGRQVVEHMLAWMEPQADRVALYAFDRELVELQPFTSNPAPLRAGLAKLGAWGTTALYDAVAKTAERIGGKSIERRAVVVVTDGIDTASTLTPAAVSGIASAIDVPVYVFVVMASVDHPDRGVGIRTSSGEQVTSNLANLASWTGGGMLLVTNADEASMAVRDLITELRHQYLIAFEAAPGSGWRGLAVRTRNRDLTVRARRGYFASQDSMTQ
ncbi:MAG: VWA domain-containing protein [Luteitalea sp.]|nr:VWA domain-containing protein [Luteitalea sp.]